MSEQQTEKNYKLKIIKEAENPQKEMSIEPIVDLPESEYQQLHAKALRYDSIVSGMRQDLAQKYNDPDFLKCTSEQEIQELVDFYKSQEYENRTPKKQPSGKATIKKAGGENQDIEEQDAGKFVSRTYREKPQQAKELFKKTILSQGLREVIRSGTPEPTVKDENSRYVLMFGAEVPETHAKQFSRKEIFERVKAGVYD